MSVFVDTGVFYAHHDTDASRHEVGAAALNRVLRSAKYGRVMTSDYVSDEVVSLTHRRTGAVEAGIEVGKRIRGDGYPDAIELLYSSPARFEHAVDVYETYADYDLSFTQMQGGSPRLEPWEESDNPFHQLRARAVRLPTPAIEFIK